MMQKLNWYPGHMKKTRELIVENLKLVDVVLEVCDARIPSSSRNPIISELVRDKRSIIILNKMDLADEIETEKWKACFLRDGKTSLAVNSNSGHGVKKVISELESVREEIRKTNKPLRLMIAGVPNSGKSSLINRLTGRKSAATGNRPGVTRGKQWLTLENGMQLLDTPGILWPKFEDPNVGLNLAFCGSIKDEIMDISELGLELVKVLEENYTEMLIDRYKLETPGDTPLETMEMIAHARGCLMSGKRIDYERVGKVILDEFRSGAIGRITLERV